MSEPPNEIRNHEQGVLSFIIPAKRKRILYLLDKDRQNFVTQLHHPDFFKSQNIHQISPREQTSEGVQHLILKKTNTAVCYAFSEEISLDGRLLDLVETLHVVVGSSYGALLSIVPGKLLYLETESRNGRFLIY